MEPIVFKINDIVDVSIITHISTSNTGYTKCVVKYIEFHVRFEYFGHSIDCKFSYQLDWNEESGLFDKRYSEYQYGSIEEIKELYPNYCDQLTKDVKNNIGVYHSLFTSIIGDNALDDDIILL